MASCAVCCVLTSVRRHFRLFEGPSWNCSSPAVNEVLLLSVMAMFCC
jgi:hypothetical protein